MILYKIYKSWHGIFIWKYFSIIIVDEAHRNTLGAMAAQVLLHFGSAKVLGVTATPFRSDRRQLGSFYEKISVEISLARLIREGWSLHPLLLSTLIDCWTSILMMLDIFKMVHFNLQITGAFYPQLDTEKLY